MAKLEDRGRGPQAVVNCKSKEGKNGGTFGVGYVEIGGRLYQLSVTQNRKEGGYAWVRVKQCRRSGSSGSSYGGYRRY